MCAWQIADFWTPALRAGLAGWNLRPGLGVGEVGTANNGALVRAIRAQAASLHGLSDNQLRARFDDLRSATKGVDRVPTDKTRVGRLGPGRPSDAALVTTFALVNESLRRGRGYEFHDVQFLAGLAIARGRLAEMQTGEGKTLTAGLAAAAMSLEGRGVHVATVNGYLAARDAEQVAPLLSRLGISTGVLTSSADVAAKQAAYKAQVTYGMGYEFGFDYLRDRLAAWATSRRVPGEDLLRRLRGIPPAVSPSLQCGHAAAIVDEIDEVLIDEARTPLVLSGAATTKAVGEVYQHAWQVARQLVPGGDYLLDTETQQLQLTVAGQARLVVPAMALERPWSQYVLHALRAEHVLRRDVDYVVDDDAVRLVDQFTGRIHAERTWREGLHQAVEAREGVRITAENRVLARISRQRYYALYELLSGMTGTAGGAEREFRRTYGLNTVRIPLRLPSRRALWPCRAFATSEAKWRAVAAEAAEVSRGGRPVLVGARTIADSMMLADLLRARGVEFALLNGCQDAAEADIVAQAGQPGRVTLATNMAGRGTDIPLAGNVAELGGLHVIGGEPHRSSRVDRQLLGRAGRQGDPGSGRLFVAADDALVAQFGPRLARRIGRAAGTDGEARVDFSAPLSQLQRMVERHDYHVRRRLLAHDEWLDGVLEELVRED